MNAPLDRVAPWQGLSAELSRLWALSWPVMLSGLGMTAMFAVDTAMVGHLGGDALAAVAIGNIWGASVALFFRSILHGLDPIVAQAFGRQDRQAAGDSLVRGVVIAVGLAPLAMAALWAGEWGLGVLAQPAHLLGDASAYLRAMSYGMVGMLVFWGVRQFLQGLGIMRPAMWVVLVANVVNAGLNLVLIYGLGAWPGLGIVGCGYATAISQLFLAVGLIWIARRPLAAWWPRNTHPFELRPLLAVLSVGLPVAVQVSLEVWAFTAASVMMGWLGDLEVAAHAVTLNMASLAFMVPLGLSAAAATRVGNLIGAGYRWQRSAWTAIALGAVTMAFSGFLFIVLPHKLAHIYTDDAGVIALVVTLLPLAGFFGFFDGIQVTAFGVLRGANDVRVPSLFNVLGYWVIGLPLGYWMAFHQGLGPYGVWAGLAISLGIVALLLVMRVPLTARRLQKNAIE